MLKEARTFLTGGVILLTSACASYAPPVAPDPGGLDLAAADDATSCNGLVPTIVANPSATKALHGTPGPDVIVGTGGPDSIYGGAGDDTICGLAGADWINGEEGNDTIHGNQGIDVLRGGVGNDRLEGNQADDLLFGDDGNDNLSGDENNDLLDGGPGTDTLVGGIGDDRLSGGEQNDRLEGERGLDYLDGGDGNDVLNGGRETDTCVRGTDRLISCELLSPSEPPGNPNFLIIISDDQSYGTLNDYMPITYSRIAQQGLEFTRGYVTTSLCCPSRASILTGMYARHHGVKGNQDPLHNLTVANHLHEAGYYTGLVGKYLNSWNGTPRPEFDFWVGTTDPKATYFDPILNVQGVWTQPSGYQTYILRDYALEFFDEANARSQPFLFFFAPRVPHRPFLPAPGDENRYAGLPPFRPPNFNEADLSDKPVWLQAHPLLGPQAIRDMDADRRDMLASLWSLDQAIGAMLDKLETLGQLDNTMIVFISDNGFFWGEHRARGKNLLYEEAVRVPFALRYSPLVTWRVEDRLVANIDIAPTIYELAGLPIPPEVDGRSLVPLMQGTGAWREDLLIEAWETPSSQPWSGVHTEQHVYIERFGDRSELYDMTIDPYQLQNVADDPAYTGVLNQLRATLLTY